MTEFDPKVERLRTAEECERFAKNAIRLERKDLAEQARRRAVELRAQSYGAKTQLERECLQAVYAYEEVLSDKNGRRTRANRTWQLIKRHGIIGAAERAVNRSKETSGYTALVGMGLQDLAFEAVILRHPDAFSSDAVRRSKERMQEWSTSEG